MEQRLDRALRALAGLAARLRLPEQVDLRALRGRPPRPGAPDQGRALRGRRPRCPGAPGGHLAQDDRDGFAGSRLPRKSAAPDCGQVFVIPRDEAQTWPRGRAGEGLKCPHCEKFSGRMAVHCEKCDEWFIPGATDGRPGCPRCSPPPPPAPTGPPRAAAPSRSDSPSRGITPAKRPPPGMGR